MATTLPIFRPSHFQPVSVNGAPLNGAKLYFYQESSTTKLTIYLDAAGATPISNPITADASGQFAPVYFSDSPYKTVLTTSSGTVVETTDNIINSGKFSSFYLDLGGVNTVGGTGNVITVTSAETFTALATGLVLVFKASATNTTNVTINVDGLGAKAIRKFTTAEAALVAGDLVIGQRYSLIYDAAANSAAGAWLLADPSVNSLSFGLSSGMGLINGTLVGTVGSSALTVAIKTLAGADPSAADPVYIAFRNATIATGNYVIRTITAATSVVVASTKTLGTSNGVSFRVWVVGVDTGSGVELGVVNALSGTSIMMLRDDALYSPTATPGNSAQVIYTTSGQTTKPIRLLGYLDFSSGEATAGTWATAPDKIQLFGPGVPKPGDVIQIQRNVTGAVATGSTVLPLDDTIPQNTEGDQYMSQAITPIGAPNVLALLGQFNGGVSLNTSVSLALFQDTVANAKAAVWAYSQVAGTPLNLTIRYLGLAAGTAATTFKIRVGPQGASTVTFNGVAAGRFFGGVMDSFMEVSEIMA